tara:strand:- start:570 stop:689 length:120 start_codon:yes stop_codon:yes gene_type:complete
LLCVVQHSVVTFPIVAGRLLDGHRKLRVAIDVSQHQRFK